MEIAIGIGATVILGLLAVVWNLLNEKIKSHKEHCDDEIKQLWAQIGRDSHSGMRAEVHKIPSIQTTLLMHGDLIRRARDER
jgi:hypothetical protein